MNRHSLSECRFRHGGGYAGACALCEREAGTVRFKGRMICRGCLDYAASLS